MFLTTDEVKKAIDGRPAGVTPKQVLDGLVARGHQLQGFNGPKPYEAPTEVGASIKERMRQDTIRNGSFMESSFAQAQPGIEELGKQYREGKISGLSAGIQTGIRTAAAPISRAFGEVMKAPFTALAGLSPQTRGQDYGAISQDAGRALEEITAPVVNPTIGKAAGYVQENFPVASSYAGTALSALDIAGAAAPLAGLARGAVGAAGREAVTEAVETAVKPNFNAKTFKALNPTVNTLSRRRNFSLLKEKAALADDTVADLASKGIVEVPVDTATRAAAHAKSMDHVWKNEVQPLIDAGKIADVQVNLNTVADKLESMASEGRKTAAFGAPTLVREFDTVQEIADSLRKKGTMSIDEAEKLKQLYNSQVKNWGGAQVAETLQNAYKAATKEIGEQMDSKLSALTDSSIKEAKRKWGALRETYEDALKADIVNQRRKGLPIEEAYGRIAGIAELLGGAASIFTRGAPAVGEVISGAGKIVLGKYMASLKDADELVRNGFKEIMQKKVPKDLFGRVKKPVAPVETPKDIFAKAQQIAQDKKNAEAARMAIAEAEMKAKAAASELARREAPGGSLEPKLKQIYDTAVQTVENVKSRGAIEMTDILANKIKSGEITLEQAESIVAEYVKKRITDAPAAYRDQVAKTAMKEEAQIIDGIEKATQPAKEVETPVLAQAKGQETNLQSAKESGSVADETVKGMKLYHGTGKKFEDFDLSKAGSGEGSSLFGKGVYMTDNPEIAQKYAHISAKKNYVESYKDAGSFGDMEPVYKKDADELAKKDATVMERTLDGKILDISKYEPKPSDTIVEKIIDIMGGNGLERSQNAAYLQKVIDKSKNEAGNIADYRGQLDYIIRRSGLSSADKQKFVEYLQSKGYKGIKFQSNADFDAAKGSNYMIFDPKDLKPSTKQLPLKEGAKKMPAKKPKK